MLSIPLMLLNMFGGIISGIWLMILGRWSEFGLGIVILFSGALLLGLVLTPGMLAQGAALMLIQGKRTLSGAALSFVGCLWIYLVMYVWCATTFVTMVSGAGDDVIPLTLWGYANAVGPWAYMASKDREATGSAVAVFAAQVGTVAMMVGLLFLGAPPTIAGLAPYLFPFLALAVLVQAVMAVVLAVATTAATRAANAGEWS